MELKKNKNQIKNEKNQSDLWVKLFSASVSQIKLKDVDDDDEECDLSFRTSCKKFRRCLMSQLTFLSQVRSKKAH